MKPDSMTNVAYERLTWCCEAPQQCSRTQTNAQQARGQKRERQGGEGARGRRLQLVTQRFSRLSPC